MNHKFKRPKQSRAGCLLCKPHKINALKTSDRKKAKKVAFEVEAKAY